MGHTQVDIPGFVLGDLNVSFDEFREGFISGLVTLDDLSNPFSLMNFVAGTYEGWTLTSPHWLHGLQDP